MIYYFDEEYRFLSNFYPAPIEMDGLLYPCVENAYQAAKTEMHDMRKMFVGIRPGLAKKLGNDIALRPHWEELKIGIMTDLVRKKFEIPALRKKLLSTGDEELMEGNHWGDKFWGCVLEEELWIGKNHLGQILMKIRKEILFSAQ